MSSNPAGPSRGAASTTDKTPSSKHYRGMVTFIIGPAKKEFTVHKDLLIFYSDYFRAAFDGPFTEATTGKIELLDAKQEVFQNFHTWLYMRKLVTDDDKSLNLEPLVHLWIFGDRYQIPMLQNCVIDEFLDKVARENSFQMKLVRITYDNTVSRSPLRKAMVEIMVCSMELGNRINSIMTEDFLDGYSNEILKDVIQELDSARRNKVPYHRRPKRDKCFFHVHGKDEHC